MPCAFRPADHPTLYKRRAQTGKRDAQASDAEGFAVWLPWAPAKHVHRRVVNEVPNADADETILALVYFCSPNNLFLKGCGEPPIDHVARALLVIGSHHKASIVWSQAGCKHASTPWPPCGQQLFVTQCLLRHEVVGCLHTHADVGVVSSIWQFHLFPELRILRLVFDPAPAIIMVEFFLASSAILWYSSRMWRRRPSMKRSSM